MASDPAPGVLAAEETLTGTLMLVDLAEVLVASQLVSASDFWGGCRDIFGTCLDLARAGTVPDLWAVINELNRRGVLDELGAETRIVELATSWTATIHANPGSMSAMANLIHEDSDRRRGIVSLEAAAKRLMSGQRERTPLYLRPEYDGEARPLR